MQFVKVFFRLARTRNLIFCLISLLFPCCVYSLLFFGINFTVVCTSCPLLLLPPKCHWLFNFFPLNILNKFSSFLTHSREHSKFKIYGCSQQAPRMLAYNSFWSGRKRIKIYDAKCSRNREIEREFYACRVKNSGNMCWTVNWQIVWAP